MTHRVIKAKDVEPGMSIYNSHAIYPAWQWVRVKEVRPMPGRNYIVLSTVMYETWAHPEEGVAVREL